MKSNRSSRFTALGIRAVCGILAIAASSIHADVTIDGNASSIENYVTLGLTQTQPSNVGGFSSVLGSIRYNTATNTLNLGICGRATNQAIILFIDAKPGGVNRITPDLINVQSFGEHEHINKLALDAETGLTFETGFEPELAIRIFGDEVSGQRHAYANVFDFVTHTQIYLGDSHANPVSGGPVRQLKSEWENVGTDPDPEFVPSSYSSHRKGVEMDLDLTALGVVGTSQTVKICAILVSKMLQDDPESPTYIEGSNQALGPVASYMTEINTFDFNNEDAAPGTQTLSITVDGLDPSADNDDDGLLNSVETNNGIFLSSTETGSNPDNPDSDGDGYPDGAEVNGSPTLGLGFISDPNVKNYTNLAIPGSFNKPSPWNFNTATNNPSTAMLRESTTLTGQYRWTLDYLFLPTQLGPFAYKFNSGNSSAIQWGGGVTPGVAVPTTGNDIPGSIPASGFHRFFFDQKTLLYTFGRTVFPDSTAYLAAYGLSTGTDSDGDGILNENEFAANTDPTNANSDGDGADDLADVQPLNPGIFLEGYAAWASTIIGDKATGADPDFDGFTNFQEYLFGTSPNVPTATLTTLERIGQNLVIRWLERAGNASFQIQENTSLTNPWTPSSAVVTLDPNQSNLPVNYVRKTATIPIDSPKKFVRVSGQE